MHVLECKWNGVLVGSRILKILQQEIIMSEIIMPILLNV